MMCTKDDKEWINKIFHADGVFDYISDDFSEKNDIAGVFLEHGIILNPEPGVVFTLHKVNSITREIHVAATPESRGKRAISAGKKVLKWIFENTDCLKLISFIPTANRHTILYALKNGFIKEGINEKSLMKGGKLIDQVLVGLTREKWLCLQQ